MGSLWGAADLIGQQEELLLVGQADDGLNAFPALNRACNSAA